MNAFLDVSSLLTDMMTFWKHRKNIAKARQWLDMARSIILTATAAMAEGTQLFEGAHLTRVEIRAFVASQANVTITCFQLSVFSV